MILSNVYSEDHAINLIWASHVIEPIYNLLLLTNFDQHKILLYILLYVIFLNAQFLDRQNTVGFVRLSVSAQVCSWVEGDASLHSPSYLHLFSSHLILSSLPFCLLSSCRVMLMPAPNHIAALLLINQFVSTQRKINYRMLIYNH